MSLVPCGSIFHWDPSTLLFSTIGLSAEPVSVSVPAIVWVAPAVNVSCLPPVAQVKLLNVVEPDIVEVETPLNVTVPELCVNVPELAQLPDTDMEAEESGFTIPAAPIETSL
jgi:hypothetical protein